MKEELKAIVTDKTLSTMEKLTALITNMKLDMKYANSNYFVGDHIFLIQKYYPHALATTVYDKFDVLMEQKGPHHVIQYGIDTHVQVKCDRCLTSVKARFTMDFNEGVIGLWFDEAIKDEHKECKNHYVDLFPLAEYILHHPNIEIYNKIDEIYPLFKVNVIDDRITNHDIHVFRNIIEGGNDFYQKASSGLTISLVKMLKERDGDLSKYGIDMMNSEEFINYIIENGIDSHSVIKCDCCQYTMSAHYDFDFKNLTVNVSIHDEFNKSHKTYVERNAGQYGSLENPCTEIYDQKIFKYDFKCPSGKIVIANILDSLPIYQENEMVGYNSINYKFGMMRMINHWANHNFLYMHCGNTSPDILQNNKGEVIIGRSDDECHCDCEDCICEEDFPNYENMGYVCTDLWAVHIVDYDDFKDNQNGIGSHTILDVSALGEDIVVEYNYEFGNWDSNENVLVTMKAKNNG